MTSLDVIRNELIKCLNIDRYEYNCMELKKEYLSIAPFVINSLWPINNIKCILFKHKRGRAQHGGDKHGHGNKGSKARQNFMRPGYETGNTPFYMKFPREQYYKDHQ